MNIERAIHALKEAGIQAEKHNDLSCKIPSSEGLDADTVRGALREASYPGEINTDKTLDGDLVVSLVEEGAPYYFVDETTTIVGPDGDDTAFWAGFMEEDK